MSCFETVERVKIFSLLLSKEAQDAGFVHLSHLLQAAQKEADDLLCLAQGNSEPLRPTWMPESFLEHASEN